MSVIARLVVIAAIAAVFMQGAMARYIHGEEEQQQEE